jgi:hypothetical protein
VPIANHDCLRDRSGLYTEDGVLAVYGLGDDSTPAFTEFGLENLRELIRLHRGSAERHVAEPAK